MKRLLYISCFQFIFLISGHSQETKSPFTFKKNDQGVEVRENANLVFFYQEKQKSIDGKYFCNNYIHPLYSLKGDTLTEEFPVDHPYHRGIFWAWHQIYVNEKSVGDAWVMENVVQEVDSIQTFAKNDFGKLELNVLWKSPLFENNNPFISEHTTITVHLLQDSIRRIDFIISLMALVPGVEIGGSDDEKGYGGLCARLKLPKDLTFTSANGKITPQLGRIKAGPWMDFSASFGRKGETCGVAILCNLKTPNYPAPWILRSETSMQNIVFPGRNRIKLSMDEPVILYYRMIVHSSNTKNINLFKLQTEYEETNVEQNN